MTNKISSAVMVCVVLILALCIYGVIKAKKRAKQRAQAADKWTNSPGTSGFINLDEIQKASLENQKTEDFEKRVNEIFEGDNIILLDVQGQQNGFIITAVEDLNDNAQLDVVPNAQNSSGTGDEVVFQLTVRGSGANNAILQGKGVNKDFKSTFNYPMPNIDRNNAQTHYRQYGYYPYYSYYYYYPGYRYYTPRRRYGILDNHVSSYRTSPSYRNQVEKNNTYMAGYSSRYPGSSSTFGKPSLTRANYINKTASSPGFQSKLSNSSTMKTRNSLPSSRNATSSSGFKSGLASRSTSSSSSSRSSRSSSFRSSRSSSGFSIF